MQETILILDCGSQYTQLIARRIRELNVYCEIHPYNKFPKIDQNIKGLIIAGSPFSVTDKDAPVIDVSGFKGKVPLLGVCYGAQYLAKVAGGSVEKSIHREYGRAHLETLELKNPLLKGMTKGSQVWMSHGDTVTRLPDNFEIIAR